MVRSLIDIEVTVVIKSLENTYIYNYMLHAGVSLFLKQIIKHCVGIISNI